MTTGAASGAAPARTHSRPRPSDCLARTASGRPYTATVRVAPPSTIPNTRPPRLADRCADCLGRLDERLGQRPGVLGADMNLDVIRHLPESTALPEIVDALREAILILLPVRLVDYGARRHVALC